MLNPGRKLAVSDGRRSVALDVADVEYASRETGGTRVHASGRSFHHRGSVAELAEVLGPEGFVRIHASHLVNRRAVACIDRTAPGRLEVVTGAGAVLPVSLAQESTVRRESASLVPPSRRGGEQSRSSSQPA